MQASFRFTFIVIIKTHLKPTADFLVSLDEFSESKHQHVPHKAPSTQRALLKVRQLELFFAAAVRSKENKATRRNKSSRHQWRAQLLPREDPELAFPAPLPFKGPRKWLPEASLVTTLSGSQTRLGIINSQLCARPDTRQSVSMAISPPSSRRSLHCRPALPRSPREVIKE